MKKSTLFSFVLFLFCMTLNAQSPRKPNRFFGAHQTDIQFGYGLFASFLLPDQAKVKLPPLTIQAQRFIGKNISLGVFYTHYIYEDHPIFESRVPKSKFILTSHQAGLRTAFHFTRIANIDFYGGCKIAIHYEYFQTEQEDLPFLKENKKFRPTKTSLSYTAILGTRYAFTEKWSVFGEFGFNTSLMTIGCGYRI